MSNLPNTKERPLEFVFPIFLTVVESGENEALAKAALIDKLNASKLADLKKVGGYGWTGVYDAVDRQESSKEAQVDTSKRGTRSDGDFDPSAIVEAVTRNNGITSKNPAKKTPQLPPPLTSSAYVPKKRAAEKSKASKIKAANDKALIKAATKKKTAKKTKKK